MILLDEHRRRVRRSGPLACAALLALLAGCVAPAASPGPVIGAPVAAPTSGPATTTATATATAPTRGGPDEGAAGGRACTPDDLDAAAAPDVDTGGQRTIVVVWTNVSDAPCTMTGFGGVDLAGPDDPSFGPTYSLPRTGATPGTVPLAPGGRARSTITYLTGDWMPTAVRATPPDGTRAAELPWPGSGVLRQDAATRPGTYLGPVEPDAG